MPRRLRRSIPFLRMAHQEHQECAKACFFQRPTGRRSLPVRQGIFPDRGGGIMSADLARFYTSFRDREPERWGRMTAVGFPAIGGSPERQPLKELKSSVYLILAGPFRRSPPPQRPGTDASPWACLPIMPVPRTAGSAIRHTCIGCTPAAGHRNSVRKARRMSCMRRAQLQLPLARRAARHRHAYSRD